MKFSLGSLRQMAPAARQQLTAASASNLSTSAARMEQAYRIEADTFGELKVSSLASAPDPHNLCHYTIGSRKM